MALIDYMSCWARGNDQQQSFMESCIRQLLPGDAPWTSRVDTMLAKIKFLIVQGSWDQQIIEHLPLRRFGGLLERQIPSDDHSSASQPNYQSFMDLNQLIVPSSAQSSVSNLGSESVASVRSLAEQRLAPQEPEPNKVIDAAARTAAAETAAQHARNPAIAIADIGSRTAVQQIHGKTDPSDAPVSAAAAHDDDDDDDDQNEPKAAAVMVANDDQDEASGASSPSDRRLRRRAFLVVPLSVAIIPDNASDTLGELEPEPFEAFFDASRERAATLENQETD
jgi:hypothetical protein